MKVQGFDSTNKVYHKASTKGKQSIAVPKDGFSKSSAVDEDIQKMEKLSGKTNSAAGVIFGDMRNSKAGTYERWHVSQDFTNVADTLYDPGSKTSVSVLSTKKGSVLTGVDNNGGVKWQAGTGRINPGNNIQMDKKGNVYLRADHRLLSYDSSGKKRWEFPVSPHAGPGEMPLAVSPDGIAYVTTTSLNGGMQLLAVEEQNGEPEVLWGFEAKNNAHNKNPIMLGEDGTVYLAGRSEVNETSYDTSFPFIHTKGVMKTGIIALDPKTGGEINRYYVSLRMGNKTWLTQTKEGNLLVCNGRGDEKDNLPSKFDRLTAFAPDGDKLWDYDIPAAPGYETDHAFDRIYLNQAPSVDDEGNIYLSTDCLQKYPEAYLVKLDNEGKEIWKETIRDDSFRTKPQIGPDGNLYVGSRKGYLYIYDKDGKRKNKIFVGEMNPCNFTFGDKGEVIMNVKGKFTSVQPDIKILAQEKKDYMEQKPVKNEEDLAIENGEDHVVIGGVKLPKRENEE